MRHALSLLLLAVAISWTAFVRAQPAPSDAPSEAAPEKKRTIESATGLEAAFGVGAVSAGRLGPDLSGTLVRVPVTVEELVPTFGLQLRGPRLGQRWTVTLPLLVGTLEASRTGIGTGNMTLRWDTRYALSDNFLFDVAVHWSIPSGTSEEQPTTATFAEGPSSYDLVGGALHAAARAMTGYVLASMWDSHRWGIGTHLGLEMRADRMSVEPYVGTDSRVSLTGRSSPGVLLGGARWEYRASELVALDADLWAIVPSPQLRDEVSSSMVFVEPKISLRGERLTPSVSALFPLASPGEAPRLFAVRAGLATTF
jgi:hypothetical protein